MRIETGITIQQPYCIYTSWLGASVSFDYDYFAQFKERAKVTRKTDETIPFIYEQPDSGRRSDLVYYIDGNEVKYAYVDEIEEINDNYTPIRIKLGGQWYNVAPLTLQVIAAINVEKSMNDVII